MSEHICEFIYVGAGIPYAYSDYLRFEKFKRNEKHVWTELDESTARLVRDQMLKPCDETCMGENHIMFCPGCMLVRKPRKPSYLRPTVVKI